MILCNRKPINNQQVLVAPCDTWMGYRNMFYSHAGWNPKNPLRTSGLCTLCKQTNVNMHTYVWLHDMCRWFFEQSYTTPRHNHRQSSQQFCFCTFLLVGRRFPTITRTQLSGSWKRFWSIHIFVIFIWAVSRQMPMFHLKGYHCKKSPCFVFSSRKKKEKRRIKNAFLKKSSCSCHNFSLRFFSRGLTCFLKRHLKREQRSWKTIQPGFEATPHHEAAKLGSHPMGSRKWSWNASGLWVVVGGWILRWYEIENGGCYMQLAHVAATNALRKKGFQGLFISMHEKHCCCVHIWSSLPNPERKLHFQKPCFFSHVTHNLFSS